MSLRTGRMMPCASRHTMTRPISAHTMITVKIRL